MCKFCIGRGRPENETIVSTKSCWRILLPFFFILKLEFFFLSKKVLTVCPSHERRTNALVKQSEVSTQTCQETNAHWYLICQGMLFGKKLIIFDTHQTFPFFWTNNPKSIVRLKWCWRVTDTLKGQCQGDFAFFTCTIVLNIWLSIILFILFWFCTVERSKT